MVQISSIGSFFEQIYISTVLTVTGGPVGALEGDEDGPSVGTLVAALVQKKKKEKVRYFISTTSKQKQKIKLTGVRRGL